MLIYTVLLIGAFALDISNSISLSRSRYSRKSESSGLGIIALVALIALALFFVLPVVIGLGGYLLSELYQTIRGGLVGNIPLLSGHSDLTTVLAIVVTISIACTGIGLSAVLIVGAIEAWKKFTRCPHGIRGGAHLKKCPACAPKPLPITALAAVPLCPKCSVPMKLRSGRYGQFWGCTRYPRCRSTRSLA
jgi:hypothetical protein